MNVSYPRYHPDEWAHDLDQWWAPLTGLAAQADCTSPAWLDVLGVGEFFDSRVLAQPRVLTPWLCLASAAVAASAVRALAGPGPQPDHGPEAWPVAGTLATTALGLAVSLQEHRWSGRRLGEGITSTAELAQIGRAALAARGHAAAADANATPLHLIAGWLVLGGGALPLATPDSGRPGGPQPSGEPGQPTFPEIVVPFLGSGPVACGTAHLVERLIAGVLDTRLPVRRPDDPPTEAWANVLLVAEHGQVGVLAARRERSLLAVRAGTPVPDLARMAFIHVSEDFLGSVADAFAAAHAVAPLWPEDGLVSWSLQLPAPSHPLAERAVSGRSAGLASYVAFRSLSQLRVFAPPDAAFTGQVAPDGKVGRVGNAHEKIRAAGRNRIRLVIHPGGQEWRDPDAAVAVMAVDHAEDALIAVAQQLRELRSYLEAACQLVAPEPWLQTWLERKGTDGDGIPLLTVTCRQVPAPHEGPPGASAVPQGTGPIPALLAGESASGAYDGPSSPEIPPCPAHLLAISYPACSFAVSAEPGGGITMAAKRMVAEAARQALESLRSPGEPAGVRFVLPLYAPLGEPPASWDELVRLSVEALPGLDERRFEVAAAVVSALRAGTSGRWRPLVVVDGTDRARGVGGDSGRDQERDFIALVAGSEGIRRAGWRPEHPAQVVLCGRNGSPTHLRAAEALRQERHGVMATLTLDPLTETEIGRLVASLPGGPITLNGAARHLAANPLLLMLSVITGGHRGSAANASPAALFDRGIDALLGPATEDRRFLAEIAYRAASAKNVPTGDFSLSDLAAGEFKETVEAALAARDLERVWAMALSREERDAFQRAAEGSHVLTASGSGWRFFHDRAFAFLVADRIARHAAEDEAATDLELFGVLGPHLGDPLWTDVVEAVGCLLELHAVGPDDQT